jgi:hypothetical protein
MFTFTGPTTTGHTGDRNGEVINPVRTGDKFVIAASNRR